MSDKYTRMVAEYELMQALRRTRRTDAEKDRLRRDNRNMLIAAILIVTLAAVISHIQHHNMPDPADYDGRAAQREGARRTR